MSYVIKYRNRTNDCIATLYYPKDMSWAKSHASYMLSKLKGSTTVKKIELYKNGKNKKLVAVKGAQKKDGAFGKPTIWMKP